MRIPDNITKDVILESLQNIDKNGLRSAKSVSKAYDLDYNGRLYPPKHVVFIANGLCGNPEFDRSFTTDVAQRHLKKLDFLIREKKDDPFVDLIVRYKAEISKQGLGDELYKWELINRFKGRPDVFAPNFGNDLLHINYANLIYPLGLGVIKHIARDNPDAYCICFKELFDETVSLGERMATFNASVMAVYRSLEPKLSHHHDERTMATFLTFHDPNKYALYKNSFYQKLCKILSIKPAPTGGKYLHYLDLLKDFITEYIFPDDELTSLIDRSLPLDAFDDPDRLLLGQDILYQTLDKQLGASRSYWRIGTTDKTNSYWNNFKKRDRAAIGWPLIGDLASKNILGKKDIIAELNKHPDYHNNANVISKKAGEILSFYQDVRQGDVILAQDGNSILAFGIVKDEYFFNEQEAFPHERKVIWSKAKPIFQNKDGYLTTFHKITDPETIRKTDQALKQQMIEDDLLNMETRQPLNQILFGPPGTGKTYQTIDKALQILGVSTDNKNRNDIRSLFEEKVKEGQIVFTTFHQNMSYEDFIEGIKPETIDGRVTYEVKPGIFKSICNAAQLPNQRSFNDTYEKFIIDLSDKELLELTTPNGKMFAVSLNSNNNLNLYTGLKKEQQGTITKENLIKQINGEMPYKGWLSYFTGLMTYLEKEYNYISTKALPQNFVLIIDEINRGNVSQIFGELITLIEEDKRYGQAEALTLKLPYSKDSFSVPDNVYIIGTMNTADRSVEALDTALRRRFSFSEMKPDVSLLKPQRMMWQFLWDNKKSDWDEIEYKIEEEMLMTFLGLSLDQHGTLQELWDKMETEGMNEKQVLYFDQLIFNGIRLDLILNKINQRIEKLLDKDHLIGHSYLIGVKSISKLAEVFQHKIIPLLGEYFYGDLGKIGLVLGKGFVDEKITETPDIFADFNYNTADLQERKIYELIDYTLPVVYTLEIDGTQSQMNFTVALILLLS